MNNEKELIAEMKQILLDWYIDRDFCFSFEVLQRHCEILIKNGYRKVSSDYVILDKRNYDLLVKSYFKE